MSQAKTYFEAAASGYTKRSEAGFWGLLRRGEASAISTLIGAGPLGDVLELGCGSGYYTRRLSNQGCKSLIAVDFSPGMIEEYSISGCVKKTADIQEFISDNPCDLILCAGALEFLEDPKVVFRNASRMLRTKGSLVVLLPRRSLLGRCYQFFHRFHAVPVRLFDLQEVEQWAHEVGLALTQWHRVPLFSLAMKFSKKEDH